MACKRLGNFDTRLAFERFAEHGQIGLFLSEAQLAFQGAGKLVDDITRSPNGELGDSLS